MASFDKSAFQLPSNMSTWSILNMILLLYLLLSYEVMKVELYITTA